MCCVHVCMNTCMNGICECGATGFFFVQHKNTHNKERFAPATRQGTSGGGFRRNNPEAVCVAALLIAPREKAGGGIEGGLYLWFVWLENGCDRGRAAKAKVTEGHVAARDERRWSASRRSVHSSKPALSTTRSIVAPPPDRSSSSSATTAGVSSASSCAFERTWLKASADDATPASAGQRLRSMRLPQRAIERNSADASPSAMTGPSRSASASSDGAAERSPAALALAKTP